MEEDVKAYSYNASWYLLYFSTSIISIIFIYLGFYLGIRIIMIIINGGMILSVSIIMIILLKITSPLQTSEDMIIITKHPLFKPVKINIKDIIKIEKDEKYYEFTVIYKNEKNEIKKEFLPILDLKEKDQLLFNQYFKMTKGS